MFYGHAAASHISCQERLQCDPALALSCPLELSGADRVVPKPRTTGRHYIHDLRSQRAPIFLSSASGQANVFTQWKRSQVSAPKFGIFQARRGVITNVESLATNMGWGIDVDRWTLQHRMYALKTWIASRRILWRI
ncbi:hypothetical protein EJ05DRAFT_506059 [Pseudovirgaria hyperparasitica]|nr:uncharacterized protein EJ05DRAFT_506059 [Pseudovirgaria hyperparasitica]KAF2752421.1 hypothetical protein EJ05DRAFT_506059 [Pseudovirgaria hyperparasitica]